MLEAGRGEPGSGAGEGRPLHAASGNQAFIFPWGKDLFRPPNGRHDGRSGYRAATVLMERPTLADPVRGVREKPRTRYPERTSDKTKIRTTPPPFRYPPLIGVPQITS